MSGLASTDRSRDKSRTVHLPPKNTSNIYVTVYIDSFPINSLVDTGAAYSLCNQQILPPDTIVEPCQLQLSGVTGTRLNILGTARINVNFGSVVKSLLLIVTDSMTQNLILGRDFLASCSCEISFKTLKLSIDGVELPLIKPTTRQSRLNLVASATLVIKPHSINLVKCDMLSHRPSNNKHKALSYISTTGIFHPCLGNHSITCTSGFYNSARGKVDVLVCNDSDNDVIVHRKMNIGTFDTLPETFVNNVNNCYNMHSNKARAMESSPHAMPNEQRDRWQGDEIQRLFKLLKLDELDHLSAEQILHIKSLVTEFKQIFSESEDDIGCTDLMEQTIVLDTNIPIRAKYRNIPLAHRQAAELEVKQLLDLGVIQLSESPYHSPSFLAKKPDGSYRILTDFRMLNKHVIRSYQAIPSVEMMSACWKGCKYYSKLDFLKGFYQCTLAPESRKYTATCIPGVAFFEYLKTPLGLSSSPGFFQSLVERMMMGLKGSVCTCYLDDILSGSPTFTGMLNNLSLIFNRILTSKMLLSPKKVELFKHSLKFLGVKISEKGVSVCADKLDAIHKMLPPKNPKGIKTFLGMTGFFRKFIKDYAKMAAPLTILLKKDVVFYWGPDQQSAWESLKSALSSAPTLIHPDVHKKFTLMTDSSSYAIGSILCQHDDYGNLHPVSFASKVLTDAEQKWSIVQKELFSLKYFCEKFKTYLINQEFDVIVDNAALLHLDSFKHSDNKRLWRWFETLQNYKFNVTLKPSKQNPSDGPSRLVQHDDPHLDCLPERAEVSVNEVTNTSNFDKIINEIDDLVPISHESIEQAQRNDPTLSTVRQWVESGTRQDSSVGLSPDEKTYFNSFSKLSLVDGKLHRSWDDPKSNKSNKLLCIPTSLQDKTIDICHRIPMSGHYGREKTVLKLTSRFYFPKLRHKVDLFIDNCHPCLKKAKNRKTPKAPLKPFVASYPNDVVQIDLIEGLPSINGYHAIVTMIDRFTMYPEAIPLRSTTVGVVARAVLNHYISRHGIPTSMHSDRGGSVHTGDLIQALYKLMGIEKTATTSYRPQSNGGCERFNGTLKGLLWSYCQENPKNWLNCLDQVLFAYRTTVHSATGYSPFFLRYGTHPRLPVDLITGSQPPQLENKSQNKFAHDLYYKLHEVYTFVREHLKSKQISMKKQFDRSAHVVRYNVGDFVYVWKPAPAGCDHRKFYDHFKGPFKIVSKVSEYTYKIALGNGKHDIVHMEKLRRGKTPSVAHPSHSKSRVVPEKQQASKDKSDEESPPFVILDGPQGDSGRPSRARQPVRRLAYGQDFAQTEA